MWSRCDSIYAPYDRLTCKPACLAHQGPSIAHLDEFALLVTCCTTLIIAVGPELPFHLQQSMPHFIRGRVLIGLE